MPDDTDDVTIRNPETLEERTVARGALPFLTTQGWVQLDKAGRVKPGQTDTDKEN